jgi:hypothetical protein
VFTTLACRSRVAQPAGPAAAGLDEAGDVTARGDVPADGAEDAGEAAGAAADAGEDAAAEDEEAAAAGGAEDELPDPHPAAAATAAPAATTPTTRSASEAEPAITIPPHHDPMPRSPRSHTYDDVIRLALVGARLRRFATGNLASYDCAAA